MSSMSHRPSGLGRPASQTEVGQATVVEQSRAVAEVMVMAEMAALYPRNEREAYAEMMAACSQIELAKVAEYAVPAGGKTAIGASIVLAKELARIWGHVSASVAELRRDAGPGQSEMIAYAWDVGNVHRPVRQSRTFISPHARDVGKGTAPLLQNRDITNQNNSIANRQLREMILAVLPHAFVTAAIDRCQTTRKDWQAQEDAREGLTDLSGRIGKAVAVFAGKGITVGQLEGWVKAPRSQWSEQNLDDLAVLFASLAAKEVTLEDVFPTEPVTVTAGAPTVPVADPGPPPSRPAQPDTFTPIPAPAMASGDADPGHRPEDPTDEELADAYEREQAARRGDQDGAAQ